MRRLLVPISILLALLIAILLMALTPYGGNVSALLRIDETLTGQRGAPAGTVVLKDPGYDGMEYWQIARNMPAFFQPTRWNEITKASPGSYAYQRFLLPLLAFLLAFGQENLLPYSFLLINIAAIVATFFVISTKKHRHLYAFALCLSPAAMVSLQFSLAEPLTIFLITTFLVRFTRTQRIDFPNALLLSAAVITREINILFIVSVGGWLVWKRQWKDVLALCIPAAAFVALHGIIYLIFDEIPFLMSTDKRALPLTAIVELVSGKRGYNRYTLSSIALFIGFVLPATVWVIVEIIRKRTATFLHTMLLVFLCIMLAMPDHIWGSITSIGRVITPVYPLFAMATAKEDTLSTRLLAAILIVLGLAAAIGLALMPHPYTVL